MIDINFDECKSFDEGKKLYRKELLRCHPDQGGSDADTVKLCEMFDRWVSRKAWEAHHSGASFSNNARPRDFDLENYLSDKTKQILRDIIEAGFNFNVEIVGSFIWVDGVSAADVLSLMAMDFTFSKKYNKFFWADFKHMKATNNMPRGGFNGTFEDMKKLHLNKVARKKQFLAHNEEDS